ncbi:unnamed protein product [Trichogramma brassicae]|uniref:Uncharacterized protein n=1 Tax=Trichogramma brassicae TaxID=86971 RepID=A0A6H5IP88_9HYME|nr:unnamed protein product [Trichogramma brassicae]
MKILQFPKDTSCVAKFHNDRRLDDLNKFLYLRDCLEGFASNKTALYDANADNYNKAWQMLVNEYEKKRRLIAKHYDGILDIPTIEIANSEELTDLVDKTRQHLDMLASLKVDAVHHELHHAGIQSTLCTLRHRFWLLDSKNQKGRTRTCTSADCKCYADFFDTNDARDYKYYVDFLQHERCSRLQVLCRFFCNTNNARDYKYYVDFLQHERCSRLQVLCRF